MTWRAWLMADIKDDVAVIPADEPVHGKRPPICKGCKQAAGPWRMIGGFYVLREGSSVTHIQRRPGVTVCHRYYRVQP